MVGVSDHIGSLATHTCTPTDGTLEHQNDQEHQEHPARGRKRESERGLIHAHVLGDPGYVQKQGEHVRSHHNWTRARGSGHDDERLACTCAHEHTRGNIRGDRPNTSYDDVSVKKVSYACDTACTPLESSTPATSSGLMTLDTSNSFSPYMKHAMMR